ncbi:hypothetical protein HC928_26305 [bacterium]|nr:hypothetical protein [bacterium]
MTFDIEFHGPNAGYILELYERYCQSPDLVDAPTRAFFADWTPPNGAPEREALQQIDTQKVVGAVSYAQAIRQFGHLRAQIDPLGNPSPGDSDLDPLAHGITDGDLETLPSFLVSEPISRTTKNALEAIQALKAVYSSTIGYDYDHVRIAEERHWLREAAESRRFRPILDRPLGMKLLERLAQVEGSSCFCRRPSRPNIASQSRGWI